LQRVVHLGERHHLRDRAKALISPSSTFEDWMRIFMPLKSSSFLSGLFAVNSLKAVEPVREPGDALGLEQLEQARPDRPSTTSRASLVGEHVRQVEHLELAHAERPELGHRGREHLHRAELQRLELLAVLVELAVGIDLDLDPALVLASASSLNFSAPLPLGVSSVTTWLNFTMMGCCACALLNAISASATLAICASLMLPLLFENVSPCRAGSDGPLRNFHEVARPGRARRPSGSGRSPPRSWTVPR